MVNSPITLSIEEFLAMPAEDAAYEFFDGIATRKMSPKYFHSSIQIELAFLLAAWCRGKGRIRPEWGIKLLLNNKDWIPVPDLTYISYELLAQDWNFDEVCPVPATLAIEIISPGQTLQQLAQKANNYLQAGVKRVWVIAPTDRSITVFYPNDPERTFKGALAISDPLLVGLNFTPDRLFSNAGLPDN